MVFNMEVPEKAAVIVTSVPEVATVPDDGKATKVRSTKKYVIAGVCAVILAGVALAVVLGAIKLYMNGKKDIVEYSLKYSDEDGTVAENITSCVDDNTVEFHIRYSNNAGIEQWVLQDYNRELQLMKVVSGSKSICYLLPLNHTRAIPTNTKTTNQQSCPPGAAKKVLLHYELSPFRVKERSMFGSRGQQLCGDTDTYWILPVSPYETTTNDAKSECKEVMYLYYINQPTREKRDVATKPPKRAIIIIIIIIINE